MLNESGCAPPMPCREARGCSARGHGRCGCQAQPKLEACVRVLQPGRSRVTPSPVAAEQQETGQPQREVSLRRAGVWHGLRTGLLPERPKTDARCWERPWPRGSPEQGAGAWTPRGVCSGRAPGADTRGAPRKQSQTRHATPPRGTSQAVIGRGETNSRGWFIKQTKKQKIPGGLGGSVC